ncbi:MAG: hypothetical protein HKN81_05345 [Gammaproteobacteria bacterium]|nr:hypothetical protein [Gammaproteobacteria bacterium]
MPALTRPTGLSGPHVSDEQWMIAAGIAEVRARAFARSTGFDWRDLVGGALAVVPAAAATWDPARSTWEKWVGVRLWGAVRHEARKLTEMRRRNGRQILSLNSLADDDTEWIDKLADPGPDLDAGADRQRSDLVWWLLQQMGSTPWAHVGRVLVSRGVSQVSIAAELGVHQTRVTQLRQRCVRVLRVVVAAIGGAGMVWAPTESKRRQRCDWCGVTDHAMWHSEAGGDSVEVCARCCDRIDAIAETSTSLTGPRPSRRPGPTDTAQVARHVRVAP